MNFIVDQAGPGASRLVKQSNRRPNSHRDRQTETRIQRGRARGQAEEAEVLTEENKKSVGRKQAALAT